MEIELDRLLKLNPLSAWGNQQTVRKPAMNVLVKDFISDWA
jgi:hypothetical protein